MSALVVSPKGINCVPFCSIHFAFPISVKAVIMQICLFRFCCCFSSTRQYITWDSSTADCHFQWCFSCICKSNPQGLVMTEVQGTASLQGHSNRTNSWALSALSFQSCCWQNLRHCTSRISNPSPNWPIAAVYDVVYCWLSIVELCSNLPFIACGVKNYPNFFQVPINGQ